MADKKQIKQALISVYHKEGLDEILELLHRNNVKMLSTGGTADFIISRGYECERVENITGYPSILGGRVKTLHPMVFGGILARRENMDDAAQTASYGIPDIDLVIVDLYPFAETVSSGAPETDIIEKIDIGGISLIRAAAKNFNDVAIVASKGQYGYIADILAERGAETTLAERRHLAAEAFAVSSGYDTAIYNWIAGDRPGSLRVALDGSRSLRYGENPHQQGTFYGRFNDMFDQLHGKEISYNNLMDIDAAVSLIKEFNECTFAILKHNNACGIATRSEGVAEAWKAALACDPVSAFGGVLVTNRTVTEEAAAGIDEIFFEVIIAPDYTPEALETLKKKKNRIILVQKSQELPQQIARTALNGMLVQQRDTAIETPDDLKIVTKLLPTHSQISDMLFANKVVKHSKSNAIVLAKNGQLCASGVGQTSRVDALKQAIEKATGFGFDLHGAVMASDAFFPFSDCVEIAHEAGIKAVIHPGGSIRDNDSVAYCDAHDMTMAMTGIRHFKH